jgi:alpha-ketoglutarate-dependent taurine dioxygenase
MRNWQTGNMPVSPREIPFVVHATKESAGALSRFLADHSSYITDNLAVHGAVLFRGFHVASEQAFERAILSIKGMRAMDCYFMSEPGRAIVEGTKYVFNTNSLFKTGGSWNMSAIHTENYSSPDVPRFISFLCMKPSWVGGETGLVDMAQVYSDLDDVLKAKLEENSCCVRHISVQSIANRYQVSAETVRRICGQYRIPIVQETPGEEYVLLRKPSVFDHPVTRTPALTANLHSEVKGLPMELKTIFHCGYTGWRWALHRFVWNHPRFVNFITNRGKAPRKRPAATSDPHARVGSIFSVDDAKKLAGIMKQHFHALKWCAGDVLVIDNLQIAHTGMPGLGPRLLRVLLTNPLRMDLSMTGRGRQAPVDDPGHRSLGELFRRPDVPRDAREHSSVISG